MTNFLITELHIKEKKSISPNPRINKIKEERKLTFKSSEKKSYFLIKNEKKYSKEKKDLMDYLVDEQPKYTNLKKAIFYYEKEREKNKRKINDNENIIKNKQKILDSLNQEMNEILFKNINIIPNDRKIKEKENEKNNLENEIETFNQTLENYESIKNELQNENINLKKNLQKELIECFSIKKQYDKYIVIKNKIENEDKAQENLFYTMNNFNLKSHVFFENEENEKKNILAKEEFHLNQLKEDIKINEDYIIKLKKKILKRKKLLPYEIRKNNKIYQDNLILRKETYENYIKLNLIKKYLKLKDLEEVVNHVKNQNLIFNSKYNKITRLLNKLTNLKNEISENKKEIKSIKDIIKDKLNIHLFYDQPEIINKISFINRIKQSNILTIENIYKRENIIKNILRFIERNNIQMNKIIESILVFNLKIKEKSITKKELDNIIILFDNKEKIKNLSNYTSTKSYLIEDYKSIIKILFQFYRKFNYIYCNFVVDILIQISNEENNNNYLNKNSKLNFKTITSLSINNSNINNSNINNSNINNSNINNSNINNSYLNNSTIINNKFEIFLFSNLTKEIEEEEKEKKKKLKEYLLKQGKKLDEKQIKEELIKQNISKEINIMLDQGIDIEILIDRYLTFLRKKNEEKNKVIKKNKFEYESLREKKRNEKKRKLYNKNIKKIREKRLLFERLKMKFFLDLNNYTSDLVKHDNWDKKNKTKYNIDIRLINRKKNTKNVLSELLQEYNRNKVEKKFNKGMSEVFKSIVRKKQFEKKNYSSKKKKIEDIQILDNTFIDEEEYNRKPDVEIEKKKVKNEKNYFGYKTGLNKRNKSFKTMIDLQKISLELFYKKNKNDNYQNFNTIKNEFHKKLNMKIYSPIVSFFSPNKNLQKKNQLNTFSTSNLTESNINNNNNYIININHNRNFSFKNYNTIDYRTMSEKNLTLHKKKKYKTFKNKTIDKYPKISSGSITITN